MGNHYHFIVHMEEYRQLPLKELRQRAQRLYRHRAEFKTGSWNSQDWNQFNQRLFDVSSLMQRINGEYARWFNLRYGRRGHFWADRYKNPELLDSKALQECLLYIELNAVRAGLVKRPEDWKSGSAWARQIGDDQDLMPLEMIFPGATPEEVFSTYRTRLYLRGAITSLSQSPCDSEAPNLYPHVRFDNRLRFFSDGVAIGSESCVRVLLDKWRALGHYRRRKKPISQLNGFCFTLREQRSHAVI
jgi:REP element-mobilizing transposase RayT